MQIVPAGGVAHIYKLYHKLEIAAVVLKIAAYKVAPTAFFALRDLCVAVAGQVYKVDIIELTRAMDLRFSSLFISVDFPTFDLPEKHISPRSEGGICESLPKDVRNSALEKFMFTPSLFRRLRPARQARCAQSA